MDVAKIPFNTFIGISRSDVDDYIFELDDSPDYHNHLATVHAGAQYTLAEATGGEFLLRTFAEYAHDIVPVVRRAEVKYRSPAKGKLYSTASIDSKEAEKVVDTLQSKGRIVLSVDVKIFDAAKTLTMSASFDWFVQQLAE